MTHITATRRDRIKGMGAALALQAVLGWLLLSGLAVGFAPVAEEQLKLFEVAPPPPPKPLVEKKAEPKRASPRNEGRASPPNLRAEPTPIVAPEPIIRIIPPPTIPVAPIAGVGSAARAGSADVRGPGTGSGGFGEGRGSGGSGDGDGGGGGGETPPRQTRGTLYDTDYPLGPGAAGVRGTVSVRYLVGADGRVSECDVTRSSGSRELDSTTCRLMEARFRYRPARDDRGRPVPSYIRQNWDWAIDDSELDRDD